MLARRRHCDIAALAAAGPQGMKTKSTPKTIDAYIAGFPAAVQASLQEMRAVIQSAAPEATEAIKYQIPTFVLDGGNLVHFAAFSKHIGFYPTSSGVAAFKDELSGYHHAKGSVQFPLDRPVPMALVRKIVVFRVREVRGTASGKRRATKGE